MSTWMVLPHASNDSICDTSCQSLSVLILGFLACLRPVQNWSIHPETQTYMSCQTNPPYHSLLHTDEREQQRQREGLWRE